MTEFSAAIELTFDAAHRLYKYQGKCGMLHGHTYRVRVVVATSELDGEDMVADFGRLKEVVKSLLLLYDHHTLLNMEDPLVQVIESLDAPDAVVAFRSNPTAEVLAEDILSRCRGLGMMLGAAKEDRLRVIEVAVWETPTSCAMAR